MLMIRTFLFVLYGKGMIDEVPPEYKPEGENVQWIPGYWAWDVAQSDFIWVSGLWRDVPPGRHDPALSGQDGRGHDRAGPSALTTEPRQVHRLP